MSPRWAPIASYLSGRLCKFSTWVLLRLLSNDCSALSFGGCEILWVPFKSEVSIFHIPLGFLKENHIGLQSQMTWGVPLPGTGPLGWGAQHAASALLRENLCNCVGYPSHIMGLDHTMSPPPPPHFTMVPSLSLVVEYPFFQASCLSHQ